MARNRSELVNKAVQMYRNWYGVSVCSPEEWKRAASKLQEEIDDCEAVLPVPVMELGESRVRFAIPTGNPLEMEPVVKKVMVPDNAERFADRVAQMLVEAGHVVFYVNHSLAISAQYSGNDLLVRDILTKAPVVVYYENPDGRKNGWIASLLTKRRNGFAVAIREGRRE